MENTIQTMEALDLEIDEQLLRARDVARILSISVAKAYRLMQHGDLPVIRIDTAVRVRFADLREFAKRARIAGFED